MLPVRPPTIPAAARKAASHHVTALDYARKHLPTSDHAKDHRFRTRRVVTDTVGNDGR